MPDKKSVRSQFLCYMSCAVCSFFMKHCFKFQHTWNNRSTHMIWNI